MTGEAPALVGWFVLLEALEYSTALLAGSAVYNQEFRHVNELQCVWRMTKW